MFSNYFFLARWNNNDFGGNCKHKVNFQLIFRFLFIRYENKEIAGRAIEKYNGMKVGGRQMTVEFARPPRVKEVVSTEASSNTLLIRRLSPDTSADILKSVFEGCQNVIMPEGGDIDKNKG